MPVEFGALDSAHSLILCTRESHYSGKLAVVVSNPCIDAARRDMFYKAPGDNLQIRGIGRSFQVAGGSTRSWNTSADTALYRPIFNTATLGFPFELWTIQHALTSLLFQGLEGA